MSQIAMVWVEEGCITCDACQEIAPDVFEVQDDSSFIVAAARVDGGFDSNESTKSALKDEIGSSMYDDILDAVDGCPVEVIKYVEVGAEPTGGDEVSEAPVAEVAPAEEEAVETVEEASEEETVEEETQVEASAETADAEDETEESDEGDKKDA